MASIGGWTLSTNFPSIAADPLKRTTFANACVHLIDSFGFDGIDIDWEYPGYAPHGGTGQDKQNFNLLLQDIRQAIDSFGQTTNKNYLLTAAVGASDDRMTDVDWPVVDQYLDIINVMTYDYFGAFNAITNHNAPLFPPAQGNPANNIDSSITSLINRYGVSTNKITLEVLFMAVQARLIQQAFMCLPQVLQSNYLP